MTFRVPNKYRDRSASVISRYGSVGDDGNGIFLVPIFGHKFQCIASNGGGWEHVSVMGPGRVPNWDEMCRIKNLFWGEDGIAVQYHPPKSEYVNDHKHVLHLWSPVDGGFPRPPKEYV
jgi:hypothetical protein